MLHRLLPQNRVALGIALGTALLALFLLTSGLEQLQLNAGTLSSTRTISEVSDLLDQFNGWRVFRFWVGFLLLVAVLYLVFSPKQKTVPSDEAPRKKSNYRVWLILLLLAAIFMFFRSGKQLQATPVVSATAEDIPESAQMATEVALGESNPISPTTITDSIAYLVSLIILLIAFTAWYMIKARQAPDAHDLLAQQARHALGELQMGGNFRSIILRCYAEMERILAQQRGVKRKPGMTVREFELRLVGLGFPEKPVQQLIYLFEGVRYGDKDPGVEGEAEAVACLEMIARSVEVQA